MEVSTWLGPVDEIPAEAMARFTAAEARLYPMALTDPAGYQLATTSSGSSPTSCGAAAPTSRRCWTGARS